MVQPPLLDVDGVFGVVSEGIPEPLVEKAELLSERISKADHQCRIHQVQTRAESCFNSRNDQPDPRLRGRERKWLAPQGQEIAVLGETGLLYQKGSEKQTQGDHSEREYFAADVKFAVSVDRLGTRSQEQSFLLDAFPDGHTVVPMHGHDTQDDGTQESLQQDSRTNDLGKQGDAERVRAIESHPHLQAPGQVQEKDEQAIAHQPARAAAARSPWKVMPDVDPSTLRNLPDEIHGTEKPGRIIWDRQSYIIPLIFSLLCIEELRISVVYHCYL